MNSFSDDATQIEKVRRLKREGLSMAEIVARLGGETPGVTTRAANAPTLATLPTQRDADPIAILTTDAKPPALRVTLSDSAHPAYLVSHDLDVLWINAAARQQIFGGMEELPAAAKRKLFRLIPAAHKERASLLRFHIAIAKASGDVDGFSRACQGLDPVTYARLQAIHADVAAEPVAPGQSVPVSLHGKDGIETRHSAHATHYIEGIHVVLLPASDSTDELIDLIASRDAALHGLLRRRLPVLTHVAVLVATLEDAERICLELPPEEYFELINDLWDTMTPIVRSHHGSCSKHIDNGIVYYFLPQLDADYLGNALSCADQIRMAMRTLSSKWRARKNWLHDLYLNSGLAEGQDWLGTVQSSSGIDFMLLGETIKQAARISGLGRAGSIWTTKSLIGKIPLDRQDRVRYGVHRRAADGRDVFIHSSFATAATMMTQHDCREELLHDFARLAVAEVIEVLPPSPSP